MFSTNNELLNIFDNMEYLNVCFFYFTTTSNVVNLSSCVVTEHLKELTLLTERTYREYSPFHKTLPRSSYKSTWSRLGFREWAISQRWHNSNIFSGIIGRSYKQDTTTGSQRYVGGESSIRGRFYASILIGHVEFRQ